MVNLIFLIGFRAVGKTTVGEKLADRLSCSFLDTDWIICQRKGVSIKTIIRDEGWKEFRRLENEVLTELAGYGDCVVATGGGAILHRESWRLLRKNSLVVWLTAPPEILLARFRQDEGSGANRPSLTGGDISDELRGILAEREPLYRETAHLILDTSEMDVNEIVEIIQNEYVRERGREKN